MTKLKPLSEIPNEFGRVRNQTHMFGFAPKQLTGKTACQIVDSEYYSERFCNGMLDTAFKALCGVTNSRGMLQFREFSLRFEFPFRRSESWFCSVHEKAKDVLPKKTEAEFDALKDTTKRACYEGYLQNLFGYDIRTLELATFAVGVFEVHQPKGGNVYTGAQIVSMLVDALKPFGDVTEPPFFEGFDETEGFSLTREKKPVTYINAKEKDSPAVLQRRQVLELIDTGVYRDMEDLALFYDTEFLTNEDRYFARAFRNIYERKKRTLLQRWNEGTKRFVFLVTPESIATGEGGGIGKSKTSLILTTYLASEPPFYKSCESKDKLGGYDFQLGAVFDEISAESFPSGNFKDIADPFSARLTHSRYDDKACFALYVGLSSNRTFEGLCLDYQRAMAEREDTWQLFRRVDMVFTISPKGRITAKRILQTDEERPKPILNPVGLYQLEPLGIEFDRWQDFNPSKVATEARKRGWLTTWSE